MRRETNHGNVAEEGLALLLEVGRLQGVQVGCALALSHGGNDAAFGDACNADWDPRCNGVSWVELRWMKASLHFWC